MLSNEGVEGKHERCRCNHCSCHHVGGFMGCTVEDCLCVRYTWPGEGAAMPADHLEAP
jgi:hypothetical protein